MRPTLLAASVQISTSGRIGNSRVGSDRGETLAQVRRDGTEVRREMTLTVAAQGSATPVTARMAIGGDQCPAWRDSRCLVRALEAAPPISLARFLGEHWHLY